MNTKRAYPSRRRPSFGSVSHGTMKASDLIPAFLSALEYYNPRRAAELRREYGVYRETAAGILLVKGGGQYAGWSEYYTSPDASYLLDDLFDALDEVASRTPYCCFADHPSDGADYGFWLSDGFGEWGSSDCLMWNDDSRNPTRAELDGYSYYARINDHGNITLYARNHRVVWAIC